MMFMFTCMHRAICSQCDCSNNIKEVMVIWSGRNANTPMVIILQYIKV